MTMRNNDYTYFCSYFCATRAGAARVITPDRFVQHYDVCLDVMQQNVASMRYDCYRNERDAQTICRTELRDCQAACHDAQLRIERQTRSITMAMPWPTPMHMVHRA